MVRLNCFALSALLLAIFVPHLLGINYSLLSPEVGFFAAMSVIFGVLLGLIARNRFVFGAILGFGIYFFFDAYFLMGRAEVVALVLCVFGVPLLLRYAANALPLTVMMFALAFTISNLFSAPEPAIITQDTRAELADNRPTPDVAYVHIILDEQASPLVAPDAMPADYGPDDFFDPYLQSGFQVYGLANSSQASTVRSLSAIFGMEDVADNYIGAYHFDSFSYRIRQNRLVQHLVELGFSTTINESTYLQLCMEDQPLNCRTYSRASNLNVVETLDLSLRHRLALAFASLHQGYYFGAEMTLVYQAVMDRYNALRGLPRPQPYGYFARVLVNLDILHDMERQIATIQPGEAIIAHLLLPHYPYILDQDCALRTPADWGYPLREDYYDDVAKSYATFWDQTICTQSVIARMIDHVKDRDDVVFVVHGDHGGRILVATDAENDADTLGSFLAVKAPQIGTGLEVNPVNLQDRFIRAFIETMGEPAPMN